MKHLVAWNGTDDGIDTDTGWRGKIQFALIVQGVSVRTGPGQPQDSSDKGLEWDGAGDSTGFNDDPQSCGTLFNATLIGLGQANGDVANSAFTLRDNAGGRLYNNIFMDFAGGCSLLEGVSNTSVTAYAPGTNCSAAKLYQPYGQDWYFTRGTNKQGMVLGAKALSSDPTAPSYIGYPDNMPGGSTLVEFKRNLFWNMGVPHSIGITPNQASDAAGLPYWGTDNSRPAKNGTYGAFPVNTGWDIVAPGNAGGNMYVDSAGWPSAQKWPVNYFLRETNTHVFTPSFRSVPRAYTCVAKLDPRANTNFWSIIATYGVMPPNDGFYTPVQFVGAMGKKNWAGPWSTPWRLGGFVTNGVPTGDETGIVPSIASGSSQVTISLSPDTYAGINADWWLVAVKTTAPGAGNVFYFDLTQNKWLGGMSTTYAGALFPLAATPMSTSTLGTGGFDVYFGVDLVKDGILTFDQLYVSSVHITQ